MVYEEFLSTVQTALKSHLGKEYTVVLQKVPKNNGTMLDGLCITKTGEQTTPTIYLNTFFSKWKSGIAMSGILEDIIDIYKDGRLYPNIAPDILADFSCLRDKVIYKIIHTQSNSERLADMPHFPYLDLSIIFYLFLEETEYGHMTATIHNNHLKSWKITKDDLYQLAVQNTPQILPAEIRSMDDVIGNMINSSAEDEFSKETLQDHLPSSAPSPLFVLTNNYGINGSCTILYQDLLKNFAKKLKQDLIILPSSIHEVLLVPYTDHICLEDLSYMVRYINLTEVPVEDRLSNQIYHYNQSSNQVTLIPHPSKYQTS